MWRLISRNRTVSHNFSKYHRTITVQQWSKQNTSKIWSLFFFFLSCYSHRRMFWLLVPLLVHSPSIRSLQALRASKLVGLKISMARPPPYGLFRFFLCSPTWCSLAPNLTCKLSQISLTSVHISNSQSTLLSQPILRIQSRVRAHRESMQASNLTLGPHSLRFLFVESDLLLYWVGIFLCLFPWSPQCTFPLQIVEVWRHYSELHFCYSLSLSLSRPFYLFRLIPTVICAICVGCFNTPFVCCMG